MQAELQKRLIDEILCVADSKWVLGNWYIKVLRNGRGLQDFNALAGMSQDELGHTRAIFGLLEDRLEQPQGYLEFERANNQIASTAAIDAPPTDWADFVTTAYLVEAALWQMLATFRGGSFKAFGNLVDQIGQETNFHLLYTAGWIKSLREEDRKAIKAALRKRLPEILLWFGGSTASQSDPLLREHIRTKSVLEARDHFRKVNLPLFLEQGVAGKDEIEAMVDDLKWQDWDPARRRHTGSTMPAELWEFVLPTNVAAVTARRALKVSTTDNVLWTDGVPTG